MTEMNLSMKQKDSQIEKGLVVARDWRCLEGRWIGSLKFADANYYI